MSSPDEQGRISNATKASNPDSYQAQLGKSGVVVATVKSISLLDKNVVQVRFDREIRQNDQRKISHWIATLTFSYTTASISSNDRLINPLGFVVSNYRLDAEAVQ
jgi:type IV secretion system protein VirB8